MFVLLDFFYLVKSELSVSFQTRAKCERASAKLILHNRKKVCCVVARD
jgi:hypothetical protein